jgi:GNAT superfamily N-acetyltransferase
MQARMKGVLHRTHKFTPDTFARVALCRRLLQALVEFCDLQDRCFSRRKKADAKECEQRMKADPIDIRPITDVGDARKLEEIQRRTWNMSDLEALPGRFLHAMHFNGACLLGAFDGTELVGFVFGLLSTVEGLTERIDQVAAARLQMYSAIMGVLPEYQGAGIGYRLKVAQREFAMRIGVRLITWTFDPLEGRNGHLNIRKLGAISTDLGQLFEWRRGHGQ